MQQVTAQPAVRRNRAGRLGAYLAATGAGVGAVGTTAEAGVVTIDISAFSGVNGGVVSGGAASFDLTPGGGRFNINNSADLAGLSGEAGLYFANGGSLNDPTKLLAGESVDSTLNFTGSGGESLFRYSLTQAAPDFGAGSYMGFKDALGRYGYLEVTWTAATNTFEILSGAYEDVAGVAILAGAQPLAAVPEPSTLGLMALGTAGLLAARARQRKAQVEPSTP